MWDRGYPDVAGTVCQLSCRLPISMSSFPHSIGSFLSAFHFRRGPALVHRLFSMFSKFSSWFEVLKQFFGVSDCEPGLLLVLFGFQCCDVWLISGIFIQVTEVTASLEPSCLLVVHSFCVHWTVNNMCTRACMRGLLLRQWVL